MTGPEFLGRTLSEAVQGFIIWPVSGDTKGRMSEDF